MSVRDRIVAVAETVAECDHCGAPGQPETCGYCGVRRSTVRSMWPVPRTPTMVTAAEWEALLPATSFRIHRL